MNIDDMKRDHNALVIEGRDLLLRLEALSVSVNELRNLIKEANPNDYDELRLLFEGTFQDD